MGLDIRWPIGLLFVIFGVLLAGFGLLAALFGLGAALVLVLFLLVAVGAVASIVLCTGSSGHAHDQGRAQGDRP